jgi:ribosome-binding protein aMBF1 (putative translation factor)
MIKNDRQYRITRAQAEAFGKAIRDAAATPNRRIPAVLRRAEIDALESQLSDLRAELSEYEALRSGKRHKLAMASLDELPKTLIQARIAAGMTQEQLAAKLGLKPQQVQRYEATNYQSASMDRMREVFKALGLKLRHPAELRLVS